MSIAEKRRSLRGGGGRVEKLGAISVCKTHNNSWRDVDHPALPSPTRFLALQKGQKPSFLKVKINYSILICFKNSLYKSLLERYNENLSY